MQGAQIILEYDPRPVTSGNINPLPHFTAMRQSTVCIASQHYHNPPVGNNRFCGAWIIHFAFSACGCALAASGCEVGSEALPQLQQNYQY